MSASIETGGPAFPVFNPHSLNCEHSGMTLRQGFAGQALPSIIQGEISLGWSMEKAVQDSYKMADLMIQAGKGSAE